MSFFHSLLTHSLTHTLFSTMVTCTSNSTTERHHHHRRHHHQHDCSDIDSDSDCDNHNRRNNRRTYVLDTNHQVKGTTCKVKYWPGGCGKKCKDYVTSFDQYREKVCTRLCCGERFSLHGNMLKLENPMEINK